MSKYAATVALTSSIVQSSPTLTTSKPSDCNFGTTVASPPENSAAVSGPSSGCARNRRLRRRWPWSLQALLCADFEQDSRGTSQTRNALRMRFCRVGYIPPRQPEPQRGYANEQDLMSRVRSSISGISSGRARMFHCLSRSLSCDAPASTAQC